MASGATEAMYYKHAAIVCEKRTLNMRIDKLLPAYGFDAREYLYEQMTMRECQLPLSQSDYLVWLYQDCECPITIAIAWLDVLHDLDLMTKDDWIHRYVCSTTLASWSRFGDDSLLTEEIRKHWIDPKGDPLDTQALEMAEDSMLAITEEDIIDFMCRFPTRKFRKGAYADRLRERFKELTGMPLVKELALWMRVTFKK